MSINMHRRLIQSRYNILSYIFNLISLIFNLFTRLPQCPTCRPANGSKVVRLSASVPSFMPQCLSALVPLVSLILLFSSLIISCSNSSKPDESITVSGTVTLEGRTDYSGVKVKLFKPVDIDTTLTNLNARYPGIGIELDQQTEFHWREQQPKYETVSMANGSWNIQNVTSGIYNIVVEADSFGWLVVLNSTGIKYDFALQKARRLSGTYTQDMNIPPGSFVEITGNTTFETGTTFTIGSGSVVEFDGDYILIFKGTVNFDAAADNRIIVQSKQNNNRANIRLQNSSDINLRNTNFYDIGNGLYFTNSDSISLANNRFSQSIYAFELFNCKDVWVQNNFISDLDNGMLINTCSGTIKKNVIVKTSNYGIQSFSDQLLSIQFNVIKNCNVAGLIINPGFHGLISDVAVSQNDFISNYIQIFVGISAFCITNNNNFLNEQQFIVIAENSVLFDSLNFMQNYWSYFQPDEIESKIDDFKDHPVTPYIGPIIDYSEYSYQYINWISSMD